MEKSPESPPELTALERAVLELAVIERNDASEEFKAQALNVRAVARTPSGVGFVTKLQVPVDLRAEDLSSDPGLPLIIGEHPDLPAGAEFVLQVKDGRLNSIEAFCYEGMWPGDESLFRLDAKRG